MGTGDLARMRTEYSDTGLDEQQAGTDPLALFEHWLAVAVQAQVHEPNAMALATATADARPSVRIVLLKQLDAAGAVFYTNYESRKGAELEDNPRAEAVMLWHELARQVRFAGRVEKVSDAESDAYFAIRPEGSRIGSAASPQSRVVAGRDELDQRWAMVADAGAAAAGVRPHHWGGYRIVIDTWEFWQGRTNRLHDRIRFTAQSGDRWSVERLAP